MAAMTAERSMTLAKVGNRSESLSYLWRSGRSTPGTERVGPKGLLLSRSLMNPPHSKRVLSTHARLWGTIFRFHDASASEY
eukprot:1722901-Rhodomonas_salina.2